MSDDPLVPLTPRTDFEKVLYLESYIKQLKRECDNMRIERDVAIEERKIAYKKCEELRLSDREKIKRQTEQIKGLNDKLDNICGKRR